MPTNQGFTMSYKGQNGYIPLYPATVTDQVLGWDMGTLYGPIQVTLSASGWSNNQQTVTVEGVESTDIIYVNNVLTGNKASMKAQFEAYNGLSPVGVNSLDNAVQFTAITTPTVDLTVQLMWTR